MYLQSPSIVGSVTDSRADEDLPDFMNRGSSNQNLVVVWWYDHFRFQALIPAVYP
jgi:hypothetical protein